MSALAPDQSSDVGGMPFHADDIVRDLQRPLLCVTEVRDVAVSDAQVVMRCSTQYLQRRLRDRTGSALETADPIGNGPDATLVLDVVSDHILRFRAALGDRVPDGETQLLHGAVPQPDQPPRVTVTTDAIVVATEGFTMTVDRSPYRLHLVDTAGRRLIETIPAAVYLAPPTGESHLDGQALSDAWPWFFRDLAPLGWVADDSGSYRVSETAILSQNEALFGLGERFLGLNKRGQRVDLWHGNAAGQTWPQAYKNVPFHLSSRGYGVFLNTTAPVTYHLGDTSATHQTWHVAEEHLDWFCVVGPRLPDVLERYTDLTGKPELPPRWSYGLWMSRMSYRTQQQVEDVAAELRERSIPADVIHIDTDWFATPWVNDLTFCPERFPDPAAMTSRLEELGFRLSLWQLPYLSVKSVLYAEAAELGYLAMREGEVAHIGGFFGAAGVVDFSNPDARDWYLSKLDALFDIGVRAIKTDFGEGAPEDATYAGGSGLRMHNLYPLLYNKAVYEHTRHRTGEGLIWGRSATAGSQRYPVYWGGDPAARWEDLGNVLAGGLSLALCGFPFWSQDIGGFAGEPSEKLFIRWAQAGLFMTHPRAHGAGPREPWAFGDQAESIFRNWAEERYRFLPYLWGQAESLAPRGQPVMRPLVLQDADDPTTHNIHDQFWLGTDLLVAPVLTEDDHRAVYLPAGRFVRWPSGEILDGQRWHAEHAGIEELPLYLVEGAIIPRATGTPQRTDEVSTTDLEVLIMPQSEGERSFSLAGGGSAADIVITTRRGDDGRFDISCVGADTVTLVVLGAQVAGAQAAGAELEIVAEDVGHRVTPPRGVADITLRLSE